MENDKEVLEPQVETEPVTETTEEVKLEVTSEDDTGTLRAQLEKESEARRTLTARAARAEEQAKALEARLNKANQGNQPNQPLAVEDYIDISASLEGLDQREKAYLAEQHKQSGRPLREIREDENFSLWQSAYRAKLEKENALKPNTGQPVEDAPNSFTDQLTKASIADKEKMLEEAGLWKSPRPRADRNPIGQTRSY